MLFNLVFTVLQGEFQWLKTYYFLPSQAQVAVETFQEFLWQGDCSRLHFFLI